MKEKNIPPSVPMTDDENWLDYKEIGRKIAHFRKACGYSQAKLAELVDISVTHLSHIETGATKLSLPVFIKLSRALCVNTEALLPDVAMSDAAIQTDFNLKSGLIDDIRDHLIGCSLPELHTLCDVITATITSMRKYGT